MIFRVIITVTTAILLSCFVVPTASAHNTVPRVEISIERLHPGEVVDVRGVNFGMEETVTLTLIGSGVEIGLGDMISDAEGEFIYIAVLPADLVEGAYYFRAVTDHHFVLSPPLTVWGAAIVEGGGQGPRDEDDGLLVPMPTFAPAVVTAPVIQTPVEATPTTNWNPIILIVAAMIMITISGLLAMRRTR